MATKTRKRTTKKLAVPVTASIDDIHEEHIECRAWGHGWKPYDVEKDGRKLIQVLACFRCETLRRDFLNGQYVKIKVRYSYAEGYLVKGLHGLTKQQKGELAVRGFKKEGVK